MDFALQSTRRWRLPAGRVVLDHALVLLALLTIAIVTFGVHPKSASTSSEPATSELTAR